MPDLKFLQLDNDSVGQEDSARSGETLRLITIDRCGGGAPASKRRQLLSLGFDDDIQKQPDPQNHLASQNMYIASKQNQKSMPQATDRMAERKEKLDRFDVLLDSFHRKLKTRAAQFEQNYRSVLKTI